jgi:phage terminase large subunit GpA-like protein
LDSWPKIFDGLAEAVTPPPPLKPSEWAEAYRFLPPEGNAEPGRFRFERTPYMRGVVDAIHDVGVQEIVIVAGTQVGKTTALESLLGYWVDNDPGPTLIVKPSEADVGEYIKERIRPLIDSSLSQHASQSRDDNTLRSIKLDTMPMYFGWAGSPGSLASRPCRYLLLDEVDKYPPFAGREADPVSLAKERLATFLHRARVVMTSTPTTREGAIWQAWESCGDQRYYFVPCPHCGESQRLVWGQVKWPRLAIEDPIKRGDAIENDRLAWYECGKCRGRIEESHKVKMLLAGEWVGGGSKSPRVGFHLNSLYSPWRTFAAMAAEFIRAENDIGATMNFRNSRLAEPFENVAKTFKPSVIRDRMSGAPVVGIVPDWAQAIFATVDTQKDWFKVHIRAWAGGYRSQLILEAACQSFDEVYRIAFETAYPTTAGAKTAAHAMLIDSGGNRTDEVYQFSLRDQRIKPTKGASHKMRRPWSMTTLASGVQLFMIDTEFFKDMLSRLVSDPDPAKWQVHSTISEQYIAEMASEHKVIDRNTSKLRWVKKSQGLRAEAWDCEVLQCAAADMANLGALQPRPATPPPQSQSSSISPSDWLNRRR